jgi:hypothetical protein
MRQFFRYFWGVIARPAETFDALTAEPGVRWGVAVAFLPVLQVWGNMLLHAAFGLDWLGTRPDLAEPTFIGLMGMLRIGTEHYVPVFAAFMLILYTLGLTLVPGLAQLTSRLWGGEGTFEQMVNVLAFASAVPNLVIGGVSEWLFGVPIDLLTGHGYFWIDAMHGVFGPVVGAIWNGYVLGIYVTAQYLWIIALSTLAVRRVQKIPLWAAIAMMTLLFALSMFITGVFVR